MFNLSFGFLAFNNWSILKRTLESAKVLKHTQSDVQWVIVDNSTEDYFVEIQNGINDWIKDNPDIHVDVIFNSGSNGGEGCGMNQCFDLCQGENILFFQDDWECKVKYPFIDVAIKTLDTFDNLFMVQLGSRPWSSTNINVKIGRTLMTCENKTVFEMFPNGFGNNTFQVRMFKRSRWESVGRYLEDSQISPMWKDHRSGSVSERDYGVRLAAAGYRAAKINDGQFIHTIPENARFNELQANDT